MRTIFLLITLICSSCKEPPAPVSYSGFYISVDTAYKYRELINFYFDVEFPWIVDTVKPTLKMTGIPNGAYQKPFKVKWYNGTNRVDMAIIDTSKPKVTNDTIYTPVPLYYEVKNGRTIFSTKKTKNSKLYKKPTVFYGIAGIKKQPIDSSKYFYRRFMSEKKRGIPDSLNKFKSKLYRK